MKKIIFTLFISVFIMTACSQQGNNDYSKTKTTLKNEMDSVSFFIGYSTGSGFERDGFDMNFDAYIMGFNLGHKNDTTMVTQRIIEQYFQELQRKMKIRKDKEFQEKGEKNKIEGPKYLEENKKKDGVIELPSGLQYRVIKRGEGAATDSASIVNVHYIGKFINGEIFDDSHKYSQPMHTPIVNAVIPGWTEALLMMHEGDVWELTIPAHLAYGDQGMSPAIPPHSVLVFELELIEVTTQDRPYQPQR